MLPRVSRALRSLPAAAARQSAVAQRCAAFAPVRLLSADEQRKVLGDIVADKTAAIGEKVNGAVAVIAEQHKTFKDTIEGINSRVGAMSEKITSGVDKTLDTKLGTIKAELGAVEKKFEGKVDNVEKVLTEKTAAVEKSLKTEVGEKTATVEKVLAGKVDNLQKLVDEKYKQVESLFWKITIGVVVLVLVRPMVDAGVMAGVKTINKAVAEA